MSSHLTFNITADLTFCGRVHELLVESIEFRVLLLLLFVLEVNHFIFLLTQRLKWIAGPSEVLLRIKLFHLFQFVQLTFLQLS